MYISIQIQTYIYLYKYTYMYKYTHTYINIYICLHIHIRVCICTCIYIYIHICIYSYIYIYLYSQTHLYSLPIRCCHQKFIFCIHICRYVKYIFMLYTCTQRQIVVCRSYEIPTGDSALPPMTFFFGSYLQMYIVYTFYAHVHRCIQLYVYVFRTQEIPTIRCCHQ